ncbi:hypothetical protein GPY51_05485 [Photorhabdus laumondii subsp. laumondii]|uniref:Photorhabdus luminescens subsp. laumondii TTO1 complete genome segment 6/17 n=3 Tax=Photorhabdus TaxID=29487 RepID=Q7N6D0_PHOLL|nr:MULTISPECIES: hypothetical protein [Photorhabdus]EYU14147.1 hypothetical protein BA1DRAFT_03336 [Photorhabdus aegyptia]MCC8382780.1 hypothetical protein [Photorhabdus laumondii]MCC8389756.1 hypothetical protein [Photorhabdus laumondii]MCC8414227.1 hypothetical protein [Photorhabdus laumondii]NDK92749.1 hypothetical protein [Photorhabdus laumondii subsp. laumondii]
MNAPDIKKAQHVAYAQRVKEQKSSHAAPQPVIQRPALSVPSGSFVAGMAPSF